MADISFTEMGKALDDAAAQYRDSQSVDIPDATPVDAGQDAGSSEGNPNTPQGNGGDANLPKTETTPSGAGENKGNPSGDKSASADDKQISERKTFNHSQAAARVARKRAKQQEEYYTRKERLEKERADYANEQSPNHNPQMAAFKDDQLRELERETIERLQNEFVEECYNVFQDEKVVQEFVSDVQQLSWWLNNKEPELGQYIKKPYGKLVLKGWIDKIVKIPDAADWWQSLTSFEKYRHLDRYYKEFANYIEKGKLPEGVGNKPQSTVSNQQVKQPRQVATPDVPVPGSGRNTNNMPPSNNFALELEKAMQLNGVSRLVR